MTDGDNKDDLRRDIEKTRQRISSDIDAIEEKLTPAHARQVIGEKVKERIVDTKDDVTERIAARANEIRDTASRYRSEVAAHARANPIPIALVGLGAGWLAWDAVQRRRSAADEMFDLDDDLDVDVDVAVVPIEASPVAGEVSAGGTSDGIRGRAAHAKERVKERASGAAHRVRDKAHEATERARIFAHDAKERASTMAHDARGRTGRLADTGRERLDRGRASLNGSYDSSPLVFAAIAFGIGLGLGALLPVTDRETRILAPVRERAMTRAREAADRARTVAMDAIDAAKETAKRELAEGRHDGQPQSSSSSANGAANI
jgi:hypothetical protein